MIIKQKDIVKYIQPDLFEELPYLDQVGEVIEVLVDKLKVYFSNLKRDFIVDINCVMKIN